MIRPSPTAVMAVEKIPRQARVPGSSAPGDERSVVRDFGLVSLVLFILVSSVIGWKSSEIYRATLVAVEESANAEIALVLANELFRETGPAGEGATPALLRQISGMSNTQLWASGNLDRFDRMIRGMIARTGVQKIKIYDASGITVYSTDPSQIGQDYHYQPGIVAARAGRIHSEFVLRAQFIGIHGAIQDAELVQSYVPAYAPGSAAVDWVFEIYSDARPVLGLLAKMHREAAMWLLGMMGVLFLFVFVVVARGERKMVEQAQAREDDLRRIGAKERDLEARKSYFLAAATHELRTPMTSILGFAELLESRLYEPAQVRSLAGTIRAQSQAMTYLLDDLLDIAALDEKESMAVRPALRGIEPLIRAAVQRVESPSLDRRIVVRVEPVLPDLPLDGMRFTQAIMNILSNACKYSPAGSEVAVDVFRDRTPGSHRIGVSVTDHGTGMTREEVARIFTRFWRADRTSSIKGTGLGMVIVKLIVDRHGGSIEVDSSPDEGTRVTIWLDAGPRPDTPGQRALGAVEPGP